MSLLTTRDFLPDIVMKKKVHRARMEDDFAEELPELTEAMFEDTYKSKKPGSKVRFYNESW